MGAALASWRSCQYHKPAAIGATSSADRPTAPGGDTRRALPVRRATWQGRFLGGLAGERGDNGTGVLYMSGWPERRLGWRDLRAASRRRGPCTGGHGRRSGRYGCWRRFPGSKAECAECRVRSGNQSQPAAVALAGQQQRTGGLGALQDNRRFTVAPHRYQRIFHFFERRQHRGPDSPPTPDPARPAGRELGRGVHHH